MRTIKDKVGRAYEVLMKRGETVGIYTSNSYEWFTFRYKSVKAEIKMVEALNCCGIATIRDIGNPWEYWDGLLPRQRTQLGCFILEYFKHMVWNDQRSLLYASIEKSEQGAWIPWFRKSKWKKEHETINRNTGNTILVYSFNLNKWEL